MSEVFQIYCPSCNSKLNAKASLIGQTRPCPKCKTPVLIQQRFDLDTPVAESTVLALGGGAASIRPQQLDFHSRYFILGLDKVIAAWEGSKGWLVNVGSGFGPARTNVSAIPDQGVFAFIEMTMESGIPQKLAISKISTRGALTVLFRDASAILGKLEERIELSETQKDVFLRYLRQIFMSTVLDGAENVIAYLTS
jgi:phage FluMu protein Com